MKMKLVCQEWLDEFRDGKPEARCTGAEIFSDDPMVLEFAELAVIKVTEALFATLRDPSPGLLELLAWLDSKEAEYDVATEHDIGAPVVGHYGRTARLLRFFQAEWTRRGFECNRLRLELSDLRQKLVQMEWESRR
jgi:hypothetical protein